MSSAFRHAKLAALVWNVAAPKMSFSGSWCGLCLPLVWSILSPAWCGLWRPMYSGLWQPLMLQTVVGAPCVCCCCPWCYVAAPGVGCGGP